MIIDIKNLTKKYKVKLKSGFPKDIFYPSFTEVTAVDNISFSIEKGESVALLGPNGAGKTTTMKVLTGLIYPTEGDIKVLGYFPFDRNKDFLRKIGLVMGNKTSLEWDLTPMQSFQLGKHIYKIPEKDFIKRLTELAEILSVGKLIDIQVRKLSLGERMKMELINSILHNPQVLFLDEPTIGLDIIAKQKIRMFLRDIQKNTGVTMLLTSHDMDDVEKVADRVIVINEGLLIYDDSMDKLLYRYRNKKYLTLIFSEKIKVKDVKRFGKIVEKKPSAYTIEIEAGKQSEIINAIMQNLPIEDIDITRVPLEEIIADMFNSKAS